VVSASPSLLPRDSFRASLRVRILRTVAIGAAILFGLWVIFNTWLLWWGSGRIMHPPWMARSRVVRGDPRQRLGYSFDNVRIATDGGAMLPGWFVPGASNATAGVVTVHGAGGNRAEFLPQLKLLHEAGYPVLMFDCRDQGEAPGNAGIGLGVREHRDVEAAVRYMKRQQSIPRVAVFGCSQGAASAIEAGAEDRDIDAVIAEASFVEPNEVIAFDVSQLYPQVPRWFLNIQADLVVWRVGGTDMPGPIDVVSRVAPRSILIMQGTADSQVPPRDGAALYAAAQTPKELWMADGAHHCGIIDKYPDDYRSRLLSFLARYLPVATSP